MNKNSYTFYLQSNLEKKSCLKDIREEITTMIGRNLKYWRRSDVRELKDSFYRRLQHLQQVSLLMSLLHTSDLKENNPKQLSLINSIQELSKVWEIDMSMLRRNAAAATR